MDFKLKVIRVVMPNANWFNMENILNFTAVDFDDLTATFQDGVLTISLEDKTYNFPRENFQYWMETYE